MNAEEALIYLSACGVNGSIPNKDAIAALDYDALYSLSCAHQLTAAVCTALESAGVKEPRFIQEKAKAIRKNLIHDQERAAICAALEKARIWHMPLKGVILKDYYPQAGMRQMADNDILFDASRAEDVRDIMKSLGYEATRFGTKHQDDYQKPPVSHFEMHRMLFTDKTSKAFSAYYRDIEDRLVKDQGNTCGFHFTDEDFYIYLIAHEYKHFEYRGTGLKSLLDTYVFLKRFQNALDFQYIEAECEKLGISGFERKNRALALAVFSAGSVEDLSPEQADMLGYFIRSGAYGTKEHAVLNGIRKAGRLKYVWNRAFPPMEAIREQYPFFFEHRLLLPLLPCYRLIRKWDRAKAEIRLIGKAG